MIDHDPRDTFVYAPPSFAELVELADQCGLVAGFEQVAEGVHFRVAGQVFTLPQRDAEIFLHGVLLGYFTSDTSDSLAGAAWEN